MSHHARISLLLLAIGALLPRTLADVLEVPGDYADLQQALDAAPSGATIVVHGGSWGPLVISRSVTLLGDPTTALVGGGGGLLYESPITLAGPGSGRVTLARLTVGVVNVPFPYDDTMAGISGGGFDELHLIDCRVRGPQLTFTFGEHRGVPGIDTTVPLLLVERCRVHASLPILFDCAEHGPDGVAAIQDPGTVVLLDSQVRGGGGNTYFLLFGVCGGPCPDGGVGGPGVVCDMLYDAGSTIAGGAGALWAECDSGQICCQQAAGPAVQASTWVSLVNDFSGSGPMLLGSALTLSWTTPGPVAQLFVALGPTPPVSLPGLGTLFIDPTTVVSLGVFGAPGSLSSVLPHDPGLVGLTLGFQVLDATTGLSRPVFGTLLP